MTTPPDVESIFSDALEYTCVEQREAFLDTKCAGDKGLRRRISALLSANARADAFMREPAGVIQLPAEFAATPTEIGERPGDRVGRYKLLEQIGEGGMGVVFMAEQDGPVHRRVALKIVKPGLDTKEVIARFEAERQTLGLMDHPHVARVLDAGATQSGRPYFVMELVRGISITEYCDRDKLTLRQRLELFIPVCLAIQHAHQKGIIHRDIKPRNVLVSHLDGEPVPKVIDFGIAKATHHRFTEKTLFTKHGDLFGTPTYMSPEQADASAADVDTRADIYSLGTLLYELLSGVPPFDVERLKQLSYDELRRVIREETPPLPSVAVERGEPIAQLQTAAARQVNPKELVASIRGELDWIVARAMHKDRIRRYETAAGLAQDVRRFLEHEPVAARPPSMLYRLQKAVGRNRLTAAIATVFATVLLLSMVANGWLAVHVRSAERSSAEHLLAAQRHLDAANEAKSLAERLRIVAGQREDEAHRATRSAAMEAESLEQLIAFLSGLIAQAGADEEPDRNIKLRTVLDRLEQNLDTAFVKPHVEAAIRTTIGETYEGIGQFEKASENLRRALAIYREIAGYDDAKTLTAANRVSEVFLRLGKRDDAKPVLADTIERATRVLGPNATLTLVALDLDAERLVLAGELDQAEKLYAESVRRRTDAFGEADPGLPLAISNLAAVYQAQGRLAQAKPLLLRAYQASIELPGEWQPDALTIVNRLAAVHLAEGNYQAAEGLYVEARDRAADLLGDDHRFTLILQSRLANTYAVAGKVEEAERLLMFVLRRQHRTLGLEHPNSLNTMARLARIYESRGRTKEAESLFKTVERTRREGFGDDHATTIVAVLDLAFFYSAQGRYEDALPLFEEAAEHLREKSGRGDQQALFAQTMTGVCQLRLGTTRKAESSFRRVVQEIEGPLADHWLPYVAQGLLGEVLLQRGDTDAVDAMLLQSYEGLKQRQAELPARWRPLGLEAALQRLVAFHVMRGSVEQAERYGQELATLRSTVATSENMWNTEDGINEK